MNTIKFSVGAFALAWAIMLLTGCGPSSSTSSSSESSADPAVAVVHSRISAALASNGVATTAPNTAGCSLTTSSGQNAAVFQDLQTEIGSFIKDAQDQAALTADLQTFEDDLTKDLSDLMTQIQACIPTQTTPAAGGMTVPGGNTIPGLPTGTTVPGVPTGTTIPSLPGGFTIPTGGAIGLGNGFGNNNVGNNMGNNMGNGVRH